MIETFTLHRDGWVELREGTVPDEIRIVPRSKTRAAALEQMRQDGDDYPN